MNSQILRTRTDCIVEAEFTALD